MRTIKFPLLFLLAGNVNGESSSYEQASAEFSIKTLITSDPIHEAVAKLESKHQKVYLNLYLNLNLNFLCFIIGD